MGETSQHLFSEILKFTVNTYLAPVCLSTKMFWAEHKEATVMCERTMKGSRFGEYVFLGLQNKLIKTVKA